MPNVSTLPVFTAQWLKAQTGLYRLRYVLTENGGGANIPVQQALIPYHG